MKIKHYNAKLMGNFFNMIKLFIFLGLKLFGKTTITALLNCVIRGNRLKDRKCKGTAVNE